MVQNEHGVKSTIVLFGSARIPPADVAQGLLAAAEAAGDEAGAAVARANLAASLINLGRHAEARPLLEAVLADWTERDGAEHERTLGTRAQLANCMKEMGDAEGAMWEKEAVLAAKTRGPVTPHSFF